VHEPATWIERSNSERLDCVQRFEVLAPDDGRLNRKAARPTKGLTTAVTGAVGHNDAVKDDIR
jgi:hypothetical protein